MFKILKQKVVALLKIEARLSIKEREQQQWQLLFDIQGRQYIVGKAGANTMFWSIDNGERSLCYPQDMIQLIDEWEQKFNKPKWSVRSESKVFKTFPSVKAALDYQAAKGLMIYKHHEGRKKKLYEARKSIMGYIWKQA